MPHDTRSVKFGQELKYATKGRNKQAAL